MKKMLRALLSASRKSRCLTAGIALALLRLLRDAEESELCRRSDELDRLDLDPGGGSHRRYGAAEEACSECEFAIGFLVCAIDDLKYAY
ncbi:MAG: hypothetical protein FWG48_02640 [Oscillospiraceae bacterium]|nr:hypothetical protein [Oscillospiraceae bacterium]